MKKLFVCGAMIAISIAAKCQIKIGLQTGINAASPTVSGLGTAIQDKKNAIAPGIVFELPVLPGIKLRPSLNYLKNNFTVSQLDITPGINANTRTISNNLQIPLDIAVPIKAGKKGKILLLAGPVLTIGLSGTVTVTDVNVSSGITLSSIANSIKFGNTTAQLKKVDWGSRFGVGYRNLDITAQYKFGFTDFNNNPAITGKQHILSLTASFFLIGGK